MSKQDIVSELHKAARRNFSGQHTIIKGIDDLWQLLMIDFQKYSTFNIEYKYVLVVIDALSKYVWVRPLKTKHKNFVKNAMQSLLSESRRKPKNLQTDLGTEFYNDSFKNLMKNYNINHYSTYSVKKASIVERVIRTLKTHLYKMFSQCGRYQWFKNSLDFVVKRYNNTLHRITKFKPINVNESNATLVMSNIKKSQKHKIRQGPFTLEITLV
ncbi:unnamed protein product [Parnassius mnemosyne]|uniref:Integrase catalytic domain-containing protein n=1 Tax=Parnassius mnemosyne TaxID=213953 RepID=A0AAV1L7K7_9NEOP